MARVSRLKFWVDVYQSEGNSGSLSTSVSFSVSFISAVFAVFSFADFSSDTLLSPFRLKYWLNEIMVTMLRTIPTRTPTIKDEFSDMADY